MSVSDEFLVGAYSMDSRDRVGQRPNQRAGLGLEEVKTNQLGWPAMKRLAFQSFWFTRCWRSPGPEQENGCGAGRTGSSPGGVSLGGSSSPFPRLLMGREV